MIRTTLVAAAIALLASGVPASADLTISKAPTQHMKCLNGSCYTTHVRAVLNVSDLETMLAAGNVGITAFRNGKFLNIVVKSKLHWSAATVLDLDGLEITVERPIAVKGAGGLAVYGSLNFLPAGRVTFANLSGTFSFGNTVYTLVNGLPALASAIAANPSGHFALANPYDASADGTYNSSPISTTFLGSLEGLGNAISNISVNNTSACCVGGLFATISSGASVYNVSLVNESVNSTGGAGGLAYENFGSVYFSHVTGTVTGGGSGDIGGIVSDNYQTINYSYSAANVSLATGLTVNANDIGGLVGHDFGSILYSFATGAVSAGDGSGNIGGLIGEEAGASENCYATASVSGGAGLNVGGLIGDGDYKTSTRYCYSTGAVFGGSGSTVGGFIGLNNDPNTYYDYWDTDSSGTDTGVGFGNAGGITGLTTEQFQSGLPSGFDPAIWAEDANINNGFPYLKFNPPPK